MIYYGNSFKKTSHFITSCHIEKKRQSILDAFYNISWKKMWRIVSFLLVVALIPRASGTRCYRCSEGGLIRDVRNCGKTIECRYGCKITQVISKSLSYIIETKFVYDVNLLQARVKLLLNKNVLI